MLTHSPKIVIFLLSVSLVGLELVWTRLFSAEFYYPFAFLTLSLAILGLGLGALVVRLIPNLRRESLLGPILSFTALAALAGPPLVFRLEVDFNALFDNWAMAGRFVAIIALLSGAFFFGGMALASVFRRHHREMPRLYMADLTGAGVGVLVAVAMMNRFGTQEAVFLCSLPTLAAALLVSHRWQKILPATLVVATALLAITSAPLLERERQERGPVIYEHWDAMAKIKLYGFGREYRSFNIDNLANTGTYGFDGDWDRTEEERFEFGIDVGYLIDGFDSCTFLSLGAGGGTDVLQALQAGATEIHAVEVNPQINRMLLEGDPSGYVLPSPEPEWLAAKRREEEEAQRAKEQEQAAREEKVEEGEATGAENETTEDEATEATEDEADGTEEPPLPDPYEVITMDEFSGHIYSDPRVTVVTEDARAYIGRLDSEIDLIYSLSSNTFAALASGAFAMAENYLFTTEAFSDYWQALRADGFLMMEHQFYMPRLVASLVDALQGVGVASPKDHFAVYDLPRMRRNILLLSKQPLTDEIRNHAFGELTEERFDQIHLLYPAPDGLEDHLIPRLVDEGWESVAADAPVNVSPTVDDRPFVGQMGLWRNLGREEDEGNERPKRLRMLEVFGYPLSKVLLIAILVVLVGLVVPLNLLPYLGKGPKLGAIPWLYFFAIGTAFMAVEVVLIQKYTLLVGPSAYSIATILMTLLVASGLGSLCAQRLGDRLAFLGIVAWLLLDVLVFRHLIYALGGLSMAPRILLTAALVAPLGFFMGMPFPKGALRVGELVDWGFAVNGAASVLGATAILFVAFSFGFSAALLIGAALYLVAFGLLSRSAAWISLDTST